MIEFKLFCVIQRVQKFLALVAEAWKLSARTYVRPIPIAVLPARELPYDFEGDSYLFDLMQSPTFKAALTGISEEESRKEIEYMRMQIRQEGHTEALRAEAIATVFEDLQLVFQRHASRYNPPSEAA